MKNIEITNDKVTETLISELESLSYEELHQFFLFFYCWHTPAATPFYVGYIVFGVESGFVVNGAVIAICTIFG